MSPALPPIITVQDLDRLYRDKAAFLLLDVREPDEVATCALPGAINIPLRSLPERLGELPRDIPIVVQCHHGGRSQQAVNFLAGQGFPACSNLAGGIHAWSQEIDPTVPVY